MGRGKVSGSTVKILIYRLGSLGDTLLALPAFRALRTQFPHANICLLTNIPINQKAPRMMEVLEHTKIVDEVLEYPLKLRNRPAIFALIRDLHKRQFDLVVHLAAARGLGSSIRDLLFFKLTGAKRIVGIPFAKEDLYPTEVQEGVWEWEAERLVRRIRPVIDVSLSDSRLWDLALTSEEEAMARSLLRPELEWIAASVGTKADAKDWTEENWLALIRRLGGQYPNMGLVMIGSAADFNRSERCLSKWPGERVNLCGKVSSRVSAAVLKQGRLFIGHDSGPMHLAAVVGTPCVAIFSARNFPGQWFPVGADRNQILYRRTECFGCGLNVCTIHAKKCILSITVEEVQNAVRNILGEKRCRGSN